MRQWDLETISNIMMACIIMHKMIIEDEKRICLEPFCDWGIRETHMKADFNFCDLWVGTRDIESVGFHFALCNDLMEYF